MEVEGIKAEDMREVRSRTRGGNERITYKINVITDRGASGTITVAPENYNEDDLYEIFEEKRDELNLAFEL